MKEGHKGFRLLRIVYQWRGKLVGLPLVFALFCTWHEHEGGLAVWLPAAAIFGAGLAVRIWAQQHIHYRLNIEKPLTTTGPYAFVCNPIYIANIAMCVALTIASKLLWMIPVTLAVCCIVYGLVVKYEEMRLPGMFGQAYLDYRERVPKWFPRIPRTPVPLQLINENLAPSLVGEAHTLIFAGAMVAKELIER